MADQTKEAAPVSDRSLAGIGGWLIVPAIGLVLGTIMGTVILVVALALGPDQAGAGHWRIFALELLVQVGLLSYQIYAAILFFRKKSGAPSAIITLLVMGPVASALLLGFEHAVGTGAYSKMSGLQVVPGIIAAAIWVRYFTVSRRVKATFVN